jgi:hypothetical protein
VAGSTAPIQRAAERPIGFDTAETAVVFGRAVTCDAVGGRRVVRNAYSCGGLSTYLGSWPCILCTYVGVFTTTCGEESRRFSVHRPETSRYAHLSSLRQNFQRCCGSASQDQDLWEQPWPARYCSDMYYWLTSPSAGNLCTYTYISADNAHVMDAISSMTSTMTPR